MALSLKISLHGPLVVNGINKRSFALGNNMDLLKGERRVLARTKIGSPSLTEHISGSL